MFHDGRIAVNGIAAPTPRAALLGIAGAGRIGVPSPTVLGWMEVTFRTCPILIPRFAPLYLVMPDASRKSTSRVGRPHTKEFFLKVCSTACPSNVANSSGLERSRHQPLIQSGPRRQARDEVSADQDGTRTPTGKQREALNVVLGKIRFFEGR